MVDQNKFLIFLSTNNKVMLNLSKLKTKSENGFIAWLITWARRANRNFLVRGTRTEPHAYWL